jgi:hypothetical protein
MFRKTFAFCQFKTRLIRWSSKHQTRSLFWVVGLCTLSIVLPLPYALSASWEAGYQANIDQRFIMQATTMTLPNQIFRRWIHSREEDQGDILVYRPTGYPFPPARGREGLEFRENGEFIRYQIGATDRNLAVPGQWSIENGNVVTIQFPDQSASSYTLTILECDEQILKVRQATENTN